MPINDTTRDAEREQQDQHSLAGGALTPTDHLPPRAHAPSWQDDPVRELPVGTDSWASSFPVYADPITDELDSDAYEQIRRCPETAYPVNKLGMLLSTFEISVTGGGERAAAVQDVLRQMPGWSALARRFAWAIVEGVRFGWLTARVDSHGRVVPRMTVHAKENAGGWLRWDGTYVATSHRWTTPLVHPDHYAEPRTLPRERVVVFHPSGSPNPEGDPDLAWQLFLIAEECHALRANRKLYTERFGLPREILRREFAKMNPKAAVSARSNAAAKLEASNRQGMIAGLDTILQFVEPGSSAWQYLMTASADMRKLAHMLILQQSLTSETSDAGPTGSSKVHESEEWMAVGSVARALSEALTSDLLPFVEACNAHWLPPAEDDLRVELTPPADQADDVSLADALALAAAHPVDADWLYGIAGAPRPATVPDIIMPPAPQPPGFGGLGGMFPMASGGPDDPPTKLSAITRDSWVRLSAIRRERESLPDEPMRQLAALIDESASALAAGAAVPARFAQFVTEAMARAHMAGQAALRRHLPQRSAERLRQLESRGADMVRLDAGGEALERLARRYEMFGVLAKRAADDTLRQRVQTRLTAFIRAGGSDGDSDAFTSWLAAQPADDGGTLGESYARLVLRNAQNTAFSAGQLEEYRRVQPLLDLRWQYLTAGDDAVRDDHRRYANLVFPGGPESDPWVPPNGHNCRCDWAVVDSDTPITAVLSALPRPEWDYAPGTAPREANGTAARLTAPQRALARLARWITIGAREGDEDGAGGRKGTPVQIDDDGRIIKGGPPAMRGKSVSDRGAWADAKGWVTDDQLPPARDIAGEIEAERAAIEARLTEPPPTERQKREWLADVEAAERAAEMEDYFAAQEAASNVRDPAGGDATEPGWAAIEEVTGREPTADEMDRLEAAANAAWYQPESYWGSAQQPYWRPGPNPTVDTIVTRQGTSGPEVLLIQRGANGAEPNKWAIPGGFHDSAGGGKGEWWQPGKETADGAALRELVEETGLDASSVQQAMQSVGTYDTFGRDPRDNDEAWSVSNAFRLDLSGDLANAAVRGMDDAQNARWVPVGELPQMELAFDHADILSDALDDDRIRRGRAGLVAVFDRSTRLSAWRARAAQRLKAKWITINTGSDGQGGQPVLIDDETGKIIGGSVPASMRGKSVRDQEGWLEVTPKAPKPPKEGRDIGPVQDESSWGTLGRKLGLRRSSGRTAEGFQTHSDVSRKTDMDAARSREISALRDAGASEDEAEAMYAAALAYTEDSKAIVEASRGTYDVGIGGEAGKRKRERQVEMLERYMELRGPFDPSAKLYRGISLPEDAIDSLRPGAFIDQDGAISSWSTNPEKSREFIDARLRQANADTLAGADRKMRGVLFECDGGIERSASVRGISALPQEDEVIASRRTNWYVRAVERDGDIVRVRVQEWKNETASE